MRPARRMTEFIVLSMPTHEAEDKNKNLKYIWLIGRSIRNYRDEEVSVLLNLATWSMSGGGKAGRGAFVQTNGLEALRVWAYLHDSIF